VEPDLAVEVVSPGDTVYGLNAKIREYLAAGIRLVWVIHPDTRTADVYRLDGSVVHLGPGEALDGEDVLPGFRLPLTELFAGMPAAAE
jgi:Uma2 family endonuclease